MVESTRRMRIYVDASKGHDTGIALANPGDVSVTVTVSGVQMDGLSLSPPEAGGLRFTLGPRAHTAKFIKELTGYSWTGYKGLVEISASAPITAVTLRSLVNQRGEFLLTTFPVADLERPAPPAIFPQFADGGGYRTEIILISPGSEPVSGTISLFDDAGQPVALGP
jgi:hypothetical protein